MNEFREQLAALLPSDIKQIVVAYSGGLDSSVLLHCIKQATDLPISVLHIDHGLSPNAKAWATFCREQVANYDLPYINKCVTIESKGAGLEAAARTARYVVFEKQCQANVALLTAHHQDDQVETLLMRILRGTGVDGLCGIPAIRPLGEGVIVRPLLKYTRLMLEQYTKMHDIQYITDESNTDQQFLRNQLRHDVIPYLEDKFPALSKSLLTLQANSQSAQAILNQTARQLYEQQYSKTHSRLSLAGLSKDEQRFVLRYWLVDTYGLKAPNRAWVDEVLEVMLTADADRAPQYSLDDKCIRRYQGNLYLTDSEMLDLKDTVISWPINQPLECAWGSLSASATKSGLNLPHDATVEVRFRQGAERIHVAGRCGSHPLKKLFQEWQVPPWTRDSVPLIYYQDELIAVVGYAIAKKWQSVSHGIEISLKNH